MDKKRAKATGKAALLLLVGVLTAIFATLGAELGRKDREIIPENADYYRNQGLKPEAVLDPQPNSYQREKLVFDDRILACERPDEVQLKNSQEALRQLFTAFDQAYPKINRYFMHIPNRIAFETPFSTDPGFLNRVAAENAYYHWLEQYLCEQVSDVAEPVPVADSLQEHEEEYIFYRTDSSWTTRGAYYGAQKFLETSGGKPFPIETYHEEAKAETVGNLGYPENSDLDMQYIFLYQGYNPLVSKVPPAEKRPMVSVVRGGTGAFLGYHEQVYFINGLAENGKTLMIMGRENSRVLVPWMVTNYEKIVLVDMNCCYEGNLNFWPLVEENQVTDLLVISDMKGLLSVEQYEEFQHMAQTAPITKQEEE